MPISTRLRKSSGWARRAAASARAAARIAAVASPSAVAALGGIDVPLASIGRTTSAAIRRIGRQPAVEAAQPTFEDLAAAILVYESA